MTSRMIRYVRGLLGDESGMSTAEYSIICNYHHMLWLADQCVRERFRNLHLHVRVTHDLTADYLHMQVKPSLI